MKRFVLALAVGFPWVGMAADVSNIPKFYGIGLCDNPQFECIKVSSGQSWQKLFPDEVQRDIVQRINRTYNSLYPGKVIAIPRHMQNATMLDFSPFPLKIKPDVTKQVIIDQNKLAWAAYDLKGQLVKWGPIASGSTKCSDSNKTCLTMTGVFRIFSKEDSKCKSDIFPIGKGGAKMPYCMYFHKGFAMHGSDDIPGYRASHGCVRMFVQDAKWMNQEFVDVINEKKHQMGTKVMVRPVLMSEKKS
jgi:hypothetical protein